MTINVQMIEQLNQKAKSLNSTRERLLGQQEAARTAYEKAVLLYKQKYGVELDDTNLQQEYDAVKAKLEAEYEKLNSLILSIESGEYRNNAPAAVIPDTGTASAASASSQPQAQSQVQPQAQPQAQPQFGQPNVMFGAQTPPQGGVASAASMAQGQQAAPTVGVFGGFAQPQGGQPMNPSIGQQVGQAGQSAPQVQQSDNSEEDPSERPFTPKGWGLPNAGANVQQTINNNFKSILGGGSPKFGN